MKPHDIFFRSTFFFLLGAFLSSLEWRGGIFLFLFFIIFSAILSSVFLKKALRPYIVFSILALWIIPGALYHTAHTIKKREVRIPYNETISFRGVVTSDPERKARQEFMLKLLSPHKGDVLIQTTPYPEYSFGEEIAFFGKIQNTKRDASGISYFPQAEQSERRASFRGFLFAIKKRFLTAFRTTLPYTEAAFLGGITVGEREEFSQEFKDALSKSGTTHLIALSGYNIIIILNNLGSAFVRIVSRKKAFWIVLVAMFAFVLMAGAEASVVRAAIMGAVAATAPFLGRIYAPRNSIMFAALLMALWNPGILRYDLGFQLSFLALIGIVYLAPALSRALRFREKGFLNWKENFIMTLSAQLMVTPLLVAIFGSVSALSLISNILILEFIPLTMFSGLVLGATHLVSRSLATLIAWITLIPLKFELGIIKIFSVFTIPFAPVFTMGGAFFYYFSIIFFIWRVTKFKTL